MNIRNYVLGLALVSTPLFSLVGCSEETTANASGESLTIILKSDQRVERGEIDEVLVTVNRDDFSGPVNIQFKNLPDGVRVVDPGPIAKDDATRTYKLSASAVAALVENHPVSVTANANNLSVTETFKLTVTEK